MARSHLPSWGGIYIVQVIKKYAGRAVTGFELGIVQSTAQRIAMLIQSAQDGGGINTAYIERFSATFRERLVRRGRALARL